MLRSLKTAATGMEAQQKLIDTLSNNIANVNTNGFKKNRAHFEDLLYQNIKAPGLNSTEGSLAPIGVQMGNGVRLSAIERDFSEGNIKITNRDLDVNIRGRGFLRVILPDGKIGYTRDGSLHRSASGVVVNQEGLPLDPEIIIPADATDFQIGLDGVATVKRRGDDAPQEIGRVQLAGFINPSGLEAIGRNLFMSSPSSGQPIVANPGEEGLGNIGQGELETSNVNIVDEMVQMIVGQRAYELNSKVIKTGDEMLASTNNLR